MCPSILGLGGDRRPVWAEWASGAAPGGYEIIKALAAIANDAATQHAPLPASLETYCGIDKRFVQLLKQLRFRAVQGLIVIYIVIGYTLLDGGQSNGRASAHAELSPVLNAKNIVIPFHVAT